MGQKKGRKKGKGEGGGRKVSKHLGRGSNMQDGGAAAHAASDHRAQQKNQEQVRRRAQKAAAQASAAAQQQFDEQFDGDESDDSDYAPKPDSVYSDSSEEEEEDGGEVEWLQEDMKHVAGHLLNQATPAEQPDSPPELDPNDVAQAKELQRGVADMRGYLVAHVGGRRRAQQLFAAAGTGRACSDTAARGRELAAAAVTGASGVAEVVGARLQSA